MQVASEETQMSDPCTEDSSVIKITYQCLKKVMLKKVMLKQVQGLVTYVLKVAYTIQRISNECMFNTELIERVE